jgi:hypothetical protein
MKVSLSKTLLTLLGALFMLASTHADDAQIKQQLVGYWKGPDNQTIVVKADGTIMRSDYPVIQKWGSARWRVSHRRSEAGN